jgi:hypothetical protein
MKRWLFLVGVPLLYLVSAVVICQLISWTLGSFNDYRTYEKPWVPFFRLALTSILSVLICVIDVFTVKLIGHIPDS